MHYPNVEQSPTFPKIEKEQLYRFLKLAKDDEIEVVQVLREWYRQQVDK